MRSYGCLDSKQIRLPLFNTVDDQHTDFRQNTDAIQSTAGYYSFFGLWSCAMEPTTRLHERNEQFGQV